jgi:DNA-damage-inducible protein J
VISDNYNNFDFGGDVMTDVTFQMDEGLKEQAEAFFNEVGMSMATAFTIFAKAVVRQQKIPFEIEVNPFYSEVNMARLQKAFDDIDAGRVTIREIVEVGDD